MVNWELAGEITHQETFAEGSRIRELHRLVEAYGAGKHWRKRKGFGQIRLLDTGELCWQSCTGTKRAVSAGLN